MTCLPRLIRHAVIATALALALTGCGRRGALEPPPGASSAFVPPPDLSGQSATPRSLADIPGGNTTGVVLAEPVSENGAPAAGAPAPPRAPQPKTFLLDPLL